MARVLMVDDERSFVTVARDFLEQDGHIVTGVYDGATALDVVNREAFDLVLTDLRMEPVDGMTVLMTIQQECPGTPVIMLTGHGGKDEEVAALAAGASFYLNKPYSFQELSILINKAIADQDRDKDLRALKHEAGRSGEDRLLGKSKVMRALGDVLKRVAPTDATVLIRGESGSGKEVVAREIHASSKRAGGRFVTVNCAAIAQSLLESELFGYRKGAFTGADSDREGLFETADGGTLFLDEIGEAGLEVQAKLLRVLEERKINRVGDPRERAVDVRVLAATNRPLENAIAEGRFREDLYYRLLVFPMDVPPLRDRIDDIDALAGRFLEKFGRRDAVLDSETLKRLRAYNWPGNVRELRNVLERAHILAGPEPVTDAHILLDVRSSGAVAIDQSEPDDLNLDNHERRLIRLALKRASGNKSRAADLLGITRRTLYSRLKLLNIVDPESGDGN
jgi:DNA-binding NtrC family response regulator